MGRNKRRSENKTSVREAEQMLLDPVRHDAVLARFMDRVVSEQSGCWRWTGGFRDRRGRVEDRRARPVVTIAGKRVFAARAAWMLRNGVPFPEGKRVLHSCDRHDCVNPDHLRAGTVAENNRESAERVRGAQYGERKIVEILEAKHEARLSGTRVSANELAREVRLPRSYVERVLALKSLRVRAVAATLGL